MIQYWSFRVWKGFTQKFVKIECGKLEEKLKELHKAGWGISTLYDLALMTVE